MELPRACHVLAVCVVGMNWRWITSAWAGPAPMSLTDVANLRDPAALIVPNAVRTDQVTMRARRTGPYSVSRVFRLPIGNDVLEADMPPDHTGNRFEGSLVKPWDPFGFRAPGPAGRNGKLPFRLHGSVDYRVNCASFFGLTLGFTLLPAVFLYSVAWTRFRDEQIRARKWWGVR